MKNFATLVFATVALSAIGMAATFNGTCSPIATFNCGVGGPTPVTCQSFAAAGGTIPVGSFLSGATINALADYQIGGGAGTSVVLTFQTTGPAGVTWSSGGLLILTPAGGISSGGAPTGSLFTTAGVTNTSFNSGITVNVSSGPVTGTVSNSGGAVSVVYTTSTSTPEPGTTTLLGSGLLALVYAGRRRFGH